MFILARVKNSNGYTNSHSLFTNISNLNLTYCYTYTRHKMMYSMYHTKTTAEIGSGTGLKYSKALGPNMKSRVGIYINTSYSLIDK